MRLMYTIALVTAVALCPSSALPVGNFKEITKNAVLPDLIEQRNTEGQRLLRRNNLDDNDDMDEERGFDIKKVASKLNPVTAAKKSAAQVAKAKEALKDATDYQKMIDAANRIVRGD